MKSEFYFLMMHDQLQKYEMKMRAMHLMAGILIFVFCMFLLPQWDSMWMELIALVPASIGLMIFVIRNKKDLREVMVNLLFRILEIGLMSMAASHFYDNQNLILAGFYAFMAVVLLILVMIEYQLFGEHFIHLTTESINMPGIFSRKRIAWNNIQNVVLRHYLLTIEMKDNQFIQQSIYHQYDEVELQLFQDFLQRQLQ